MDGAKNNVLLPKEMLRIIFSFLPPPDLKAAVLVCKRWAEVGQSPRLWSWVSFTVNQTNLESMPHRMRLRRLQNVSRLSIKAPSLSEELIEAVSLHLGLKKVETHHGCTNMSSVSPGLLARAFSKMEDLILPSIVITAEHLNSICTSLAFSEKSTQKGKIDLSGNNLCETVPELLAEAVVRFKHVNLLQSFVTKYVPHGQAIFEALGGPHSCVQHLQLDGVDLSTVDAQVLAKQVSKMHFAHLSDVELTTQQVKALFTAIGEKESRLKKLVLCSNQISLVEPAIFSRPVRFLQSLCLQDKGLTRNQVWAMGNMVRWSQNLQLQRLCLNGKVYGLKNPRRPRDLMPVVEGCKTHVQRKS